MTSIGKVLRLKSTLVTALVYAIVALVCTQIPLLNYLGYEFSASFGIVIGLLAGLLTLSFCREWFGDEKSPSTRELVSFSLVALSVNALIILPPLLVISLNAFIVKNCSFGEGIAFFLLIPCVTLLFAVSLGISTAYWFRHSLYWYIFFFIAILLHPVYVTMTSPQLFAYNFFFGFFPGFTYDEVLRISTPLLLFRGLTVVAAATIFSLSIIVAEPSRQSESFFAKVKSLRRIISIHPLSLFSLGGLLILGAAYVLRSELGFQYSDRYIQAQLGGKHSTAHFTIYYSPTAVSEDRIKWLAAEQEFRFMEVNRVLRTDFHGRIESYVYPSSEVKRRFIGTSTTNIAKPWLREIHLSLDSFESSFRHELVHVLAGQYGMPVLRVSPAPGLIEGLAVAIDWNSGDRTPHEFAAALIQSGLVSNIRDLFSFTGFAAKPSSVSYLLSGSFCRFLMEEYGLRRFLALYKYGQFEAVYGRALEELVAEWKDYLQDVEVRPTDYERARLLFARPSIFSKVCARTIADLNERASKLFNDKKYLEASTAFRASYAVSGNREARIGLISSEFRLGKYDSLIAMIQNILADSTLAHSYLPLKLTLGDCNWLIGDKTAAASLYRELRSMDLSEAYNEACAIRLESFGKPRIELSMVRYLSAAGDDTGRAQILRELLSESPNSPVGLYLGGRAAMREGKYKVALDTLARIKPTFSDPLLNFQLEKMMGYSHLRVKNFQEAKIHFWQSLNYTKNEGDHNLIQNLIELSDWMDDHRSQLE